MRMIAPAIPVTIPPTCAALAPSLSPICPDLIAAAITLPVKREPAASGPTTIWGHVPSKAYKKGLKTNA
jgi:hypothetical protein